MKTIVKVIFGSHLYGINTETSDKDFKGVFLPSKDQILLGKIPKSLTKSTKIDKTSKNTQFDIDLEMYSLHYFINLACEGETIALDMLHVPDDKVIEKHPIWDEIVLNRQKFYTKNLKAFVGYARRQASKYGIKGSRLNDIKKVLDFFSNYMFTEYEYDPHPILKNIWSQLPDGEHIFKHPPDKNGIRMYEVCSKKIPETSTIIYAINIVRNIYDNYNERAKQASNNEGIDWKAVSHAFRAAYEVKQILTEGTITFPLKESQTLLLIKQGKLDYNTIVAPELEHLMDEIEKLSKESSLPEKIDRNFWNNFIFYTLEKYCFYKD